MSDTPATALDLAELRRAIQFANYDPDAMMQAAKEAGVEGKGDEDSPISEASCKSGGSHGLCQTHSTCDFVRNRITTLTSTIKELLSQLPEGMKHCTILSKQCEKGHGWLTATNWLQHGCPTCVLDEATRLNNEMKELLDKACDQRDKAEKELEAKLTALLNLYKSSDDERLKETEEAHTEAEKWKKEGDMYGWNFHEGRAGGTTHGSIFFYRIYRKLTEYLGVKP